LTSSLEVLDDDDMQEIKKIQQMLNPNEEVLVVERQSRQNIASDIIMKNFLSTSFYD
jgi:signal recognition particle GTPase